jgi:hypothetical protein
MRSVSFLREGQRPAEEICPLSAAFRTANRYEFRRRPSIQLWFQYSAWISGVASDAASYVLSELEMKQIC